MHYSKHSRVREIENARQWVGNGQVSSYMGLCISYL